jgi:hypothetical protein
MNAAGTTGPPRSPGASRTVSSTVFTDRNQRLGFARADCSTL